MTKLGLEGGERHTARGLSSLRDGTVLDKATHIVYRCTQILVKNNQGVRLPFFMSIGYSILYVRFGINAPCHCSSLQHPAITPPPLPIICFVKYGYFEYMYVLPKIILQ